MEVVWDKIMKWLNEPNSYFAYGAIAVLTICLLYAVSLIIGKIFKVKQHWDEHHKHKH